MRSQVTALVIYKEGNWRRCIIPCLSRRVGKAGSRLNEGMQGRRELVLGQTCYAIVRGTRSRDRRRGSKDKNKGGEKVAETSHIDGDSQ
jgi:hypothetical protein